MARPRKAIDLATLEKLAAINCSHAEMASVLGCSSDTLERNYAAVIKKGRAQGRMSLKRKQYEVAMTGNVTMLIWLGKQMLDQSDKQDARVATQVVPANDTQVELFEGWLTKAKAERGK